MSDKMLRPGRAWLYVALAFLGLLFYYPVFSFPLVHDDIAFITLNPSIGRWDNVLEVFLKPVTPLASDNINTPYYRPVLEVLYRIQFLFFGVKAGGYHVVNVLWHICNTFLVFFMALQWRSGRWAAFLGAGIFLLHPVQTQAVTCVSGISNLAVTFFILVSFIAYRRGWLFVGVTASMAGLFSKELAVVLPFLLLWYMGCGAGSRDSGKSKRWLVLLCAFSLTGAFLWWRKSLFPASEAQLFGCLGEFLYRLAAIPGTLMMYGRLLVWPVDLHYYRSVDILSPWLGPALMFVLLGAGGYGITRHLKISLRSMSIFGFCWALIALLPVLNIVPLINEFAHVQAAEHFLYLPMAGLCASIAVVLGRAWYRIDRRVFVAGSFILLSLLGGMSGTQFLQWRGEIPLFERSVQFQPKLGRVRGLLAQAYFQAGRFEEARAQYSIALQIMTEYVKKTGQSPAADVYRQYIKSFFLERGKVQLMLRNYEAAGEDFANALQVVVESPGSSDAAYFDSLAATNIAVLAMQAHDPDKARKYFQLAVVRHARNAEALNNLGMFCWQRGQKENARFWFERALYVSPVFRQAWENLKKLEDRER